VSGESLQELFERARGLDGEARDRLLAELDAAVHPQAARLRRLLAAAEAGDSPLDRHPFDVLDGDPPAPARIGPYRIVRELGRGGMGRVYLAEQEGADFRRQVALKVVSPGGGGGDLDRRVRDERRILAGLEHPGIARFYDAGQVPGGAWYLALEYVEGSDLLAHVRDRGLDVHERLRLLLDVLDAVAYAHSRGVVHRDLKPGNIQVGADGRPRLLDFGIAKLIEADPGAPVTLTRTEHRALTPAYASPEQFRGERVTPASDVFSLGVVLYELLTGVRPFAPGARSPTEVERAVLGEDPASPSSALRRPPTGPGDPPTTAAPPAATGVGGARRDLDAICLKALAKSPDARYASAAGLADDLRAWLAGRPVSARGGGLVYRLARQLRRHRGQLTTAAALAVAAGALLVALATWRSHPSAPGTAPRQPYPPQSGPAPSLEELRRRFAEAPGDLVAGARLATTLASRGEAAEGAIVIGRLRQLPGAAGDPLLDFAESAVATHLDQPQRALALVDRALAVPPEQARPELLARLRLSRARALAEIGQTDAVEPELEAAADAARRSGDDLTLAVALNDLAVEKLMAGDLAAGEALLEQSLAAATRAADLFRVGLVGHNLAGLALLRGDPASAESRLRAAITAFETTQRERHAASALGELALALTDLGRPREAEQALDQAIARLRRLDHKTSLASALARRAEARIARGDFEAASVLAEEIEQGARQSGSTPSLALAERVRALAAGSRGDLATARDRFAAARRLFSESGNLDLAAETDLLQAEAELAAGEAAGAAERIEPLLAAGGGDPRASQTTFLATALRVRLAAGRGETTAAARDLAALGDGEHSPSCGRRLAFLEARAALATAEGRPAEARRDLAAALALARSLERRRHAAAIERQLVAPGETGATD